MNTNLFLVAKYWLFCHPKIYIQFEATRGTLAQEAQPTWKVSVIQNQSETEVKISLSTENSTKCSNISSTSNNSANKKDVTVYKSIFVNVSSSTHPSKWTHSTKLLRWPFKVHGALAETTTLAKRFPM